MSALRFNEGKAELGYILDFNRALDAVAKVCSQGAVKYKPRNWKAGGKPDKEYIESCLRHLRDWANVGQYDPDIGTLHIANAAWNLLALLELNITPDHEVLDPDFDQESFVAKYTETPKTKLQTELEQLNFLEPFEWERPRKPVVMDVDSFEFWEKQ